VEEISTANEDQRAIRETVARFVEEEVNPPAAEKPRMSLAVMPRQLKDLPVQYSLDDSPAMASGSRPPVSSVSCRGAVWNRARSRTRAPG